MKIAIHKNGLIEKSAPLILILKIDFYGCRFFLKSTSIMSTLKFDMINVNFLFKIDIINIIFCLRDEKKD